MLLRWQAWMNCWAGALEPVCVLGGRRGYSAGRVRPSGCVDSVARVTGST